MDFNILHISDLHIAVNNLLQEKVLNSLILKTENLTEFGLKYDIIIVSGDIAFSGKKTEYEIAANFLCRLSTAAKCELENIFVIPGNHDVDRTTLKKEHLKWWYAFTDEEELTQNLKSDISFPTLIKKNEAFFEFSKGYAPVSMGSYGEYTHVLNPKKNIKIKIVGLNSSIFCGYDGDDKEKLALGIEQVDNCLSENDCKKEIVITCVHHPKKCFHPCERPTLATIERNSDIILSGHLHTEEVFAKSGSNTGETILISAGAAYESKKYSNAFNSITINLNNGQSTVVFYKYLPAEHQWIQNRDINHLNNGIFDFSLSAKFDFFNTITNDIKDTYNTIPLKQYRVTLDASFDDLNRESVNRILSQLQQVTNDISTSIVKMEVGSVKLYFETNSEIALDLLNRIRTIDGLDVLEFTKIDEDDIHIKTGQIDKSVYHWKTFLKPEFLNDLSNPGTNFSHNRVDDITLKDLFVPPNLKVIKLEKINKEKDKILSSKEVFNKKFDVPFRIVIYGEDSSGKTTLGRWCYEKLYDEGYIPIFINGSVLKDISENKIKRVFQQAFEKQYNGINKGDILDYEADRLIVIIDDFHRVRLKEAKYKASLIRSLEKVFKNIILTGNDLMQFDSYTSKNGSEKQLLEDFDRYSILEFGPKLRYELIKKWNSLGQNQLEPNELIRLNIDTEAHIDSIIGNNFVPPFPIYLLTILQAREAVTSIQKPEYSIHGFYYELLINDALNKAVKKKEDISLYYNYITEYAYFIFNEDIRLEPLSRNSFIKFHTYYCSEYNISIEYNNVLETLINSKLLKFKDDSIHITFKYVYYFFVARYLANNISDDKIREKIKALCQRIHRDEFSSIVMYLTHLSKDSFIINELLTNSRALFSELAPIKLEADVSFINEMINKLPAQVYEPIDINQVREEELDNKEEIQQLEEEFEKNKDILDYSINEDISTLDMLSKMIRAIKTIEIVGQVTKKYWGELKASQKLELAEETYMLGLRTLSFYYSIISDDTDMVVYYLKHIFKKRFEKHQLDKAQIDKATRNYLFGICTMASFGIIKKVTNAIGYDKLSGTFEDLLIKHNYNSVKLIDTSIKLDYNSKFPWDEIIELKLQFDNNFISKVVLQNLVINYLYIYHTTIAEKQRICEYLEISMDVQRQIELQSVTRRD